jgi:CRISPR-associated protein Cas1
VLLELLSRQIGDQDLLSLIRHWLTVDVLDFRELVPVISGVPQGESLSPLLANIYLDPLDKHFEHLGLDFVRFADDIIVLTRSQEEAQRALKVLENFLLNPLRLELKPAKTNYVSVVEGFDFLGFKIKKDSLEVKPKRFDDIQAVLLRYIQVLGSASSTLDAQVSSITQINAIIRGFRNYFALPDERPITEQMHFLDTRTEEIAHEYLPLEIRRDPAWICRERFCLSRKMEEIESEEEAQERKIKTGGGYPDEGHSMRNDPLKNMDYPDNEQIVQGKPSVTGDDPDDEEPKEGGLNGTVVQEGDRLYVLTHGGYLTISGQDLIIRKRKTEIHRRPLSELGLVFLQGIGMTMAVNLQLRLAQLDIPVVFAPPVGAPIAVLNPISSPRSYLRSRQVLRRDDQDIIATGLNMLASKVGNQAAILRYFSKYRKKTNPDIACQLIQASEEMRSFSNNIRSLDPGSASVRSVAMGLEGHAAAIYWRHLMKIIPQELDFNGRITKSASDAVNQCLNYIYGILYGEVWRAIVKAGLDPYFGLIHGSKRDQGSLVFDLIEEFRAPFCDRLVLGMLGRGFKPVIGIHGILKTRTRRQLAIAFSKQWLKKMGWRSHMVSPALILEKQAERLAKVFNYEGGYHPFKMRW